MARAFGVLCGVLAAWLCAATGAAAEDAIDLRDESSIEDSDRGASDRRAVEALALYEPATRDAILEATLHPDIIAGLREIQVRSSGEFRDLAKPFDREHQAQLWDLVRFPDLLDAIVD